MRKILLPLHKCANGFRRHCRMRVCACVSLRSPLRRSAEREKMIFLLIIYCHNVFMWLRVLYVCVCAWALIDSMAAELGSLPFGYGLPRSYNSILFASFYSVYCFALSLPLSLSLLDLHAFFSLLPQPASAKACTNPCPLRRQCNDLLDFAIRAFIMFSFCHAIRCTINGRTQITIFFLAAILGMQTAEQANPFSSTD